MEIKPTTEQIQKINQSIGICRWLYNSYIAKNIETYEKDKTFITAMSFDKYINNEVKILEDFKWINNCGSKARKKAITNAETSFKNFLKNQSKFPKFKKKYKSNMGLYFPKNNNTDWTLERHRVKIPTLGWIRLKEYGYIPLNSVIKSGTISQKADRYYVSILVKENFITPQKPTNDGIGIDLGLKDFAILSNNVIYKNINKTSNINKLEKKLKCEQRKLSRKYESSKNNKKIIKKGEATRQNTNIKKQTVKVQKIYHKLANIRTDYINKIVSSIIKQKLSFIALEDLNIRGMMKNRHLSKAISKQKFYEFRTKLTTKGNQNNIEIRIVDRFFPSTKMCSCCGEIKKDLKLKDRIYNCEYCNNSIDRDLNASINLKNAKKYKRA